MGETEQKASIIQIIKEAALLYKKNAGLFLLISFLGFSIDILKTIFNHYQTLTPEYYPIFLLVIICFFLLNTFILIAAYICISYRLHHKDITIKNAFKTAKNRFWEYILIQFLLFLILLLPIILTQQAYNIENTPVKWLIIAIISIPEAYLNTIFVFAPLMAILVKGGVKYFRVSKKLVEGYFWQTLLLTVFLPFVFTIPYQLYSHLLTDFSIMIPISPIIASLLNHLILLFASPLVYSISVILLNELIRIKNIYLPLNHPNTYKIVAKEAK